MAIAAAVFRGDAEQVRALIEAVEHNCVCDPPGRGNCLTHQAMLDQRWLDGLLFARYLTERLMLEEFR